MDITLWGTMRSTLMEKSEQAKMVASSSLGAVFGFIGGTASQKLGGLGIGLILAMLLLVSLAGLMLARRQGEKERAKAKEERQKELQAERELARKERQEEIADERRRRAEDNQKEHEKFLDERIACAGACGAKVPRRELWLLPDDHLFKGNEVCKGCFEQQMQRKPDPSKDKFAHSESIQQRKQ